MICVIIFQHYIRLKQVTSGCFCQQVFCSPVVCTDHFVRYIYYYTERVHANLTVNMDYRYRRLINRQRMKSYYITLSLNRFNYTDDDTCIIPHYINY